MNAERLLQLYDRVSEAPDAIPRLRRFILDLAVRGKLVEQDPSDEPAPSLLKRIKVERARLAEFGELRISRPEASVMASDVVHELPEGWAWTKLGSVIRLVSGQHLQPPEYSEEPKSALPYITGPSDFGSHGLSPTRYALVRKSVARRGELLLTVKGSGVGKAELCDLDQVAISRQLMSLKAIIWDDAYMALVVAQFAETMRQQARSLIPGIARQDIQNFLLAMPPLFEQHRIVAKVDELMTHCDSLEAEREKRQATRDRLTMASLSRLTAPDVDEEQFKAHAEFAIKVLPELTTRPDQIKVLRQTILGLAVRGKLVEQDPNDEPIDNVLTRIQAQKEQLEASRKRNHNKHCFSLDVQEIPFNVPNHWRWVYIQLLAEKITDGEHLSPTKTQSGMPLLTASHVTDKGVVFDNPQYVAWNDGEKFRLRCDPRRGDILICSRGTIGRCAVVTGDEVFCLMGSVIQVRLSLECLSSYVEAFLSTASAQLKMRGMSGATAVKALYLKDIRLCPIALPPAAEQKRIMAKVDELIKLCDQLERDCTYGEKTRRRLLESLLLEALKPTDMDAA